MKKHYRNILLIILFIFSLIIMDNLLGMGLKSLPQKDSRDPATLVWDDLYDIERNSIDVMFLGSSHARFAFNTDYFDQELKLNTFNLSSSDQTPVVGYYAFKQAIEKQNPKLLVYEAYWSKLCSTDNTTAATFVYDYLESPTIRAELLLTLNREKNYKEFVLDSLVKTYKYRNRLFTSLDYIMRGGLNEKPVFNDNNNVFSDYIYMGKGYLYSDQLVTKKIIENSTFTRTKDYKFNDKQIEYFDKTMELCKEKGIKVIVVTAPLPADTIKYVKDYDEYSKKINSMAKKHGLEYIDYNLINKDGKVFDNMCFRDSNHVNANGAIRLAEKMLSTLKKYT